MPKLTSDNTPIRVDFLPIARVRLPGRIGMTIAPGKKIKGIYGHWHRDLEQDLLRIKMAFGASVLVCLLEDSEFQLLQVEALPETARRLGFDLMQLPIPDVGVPDNMERLQELVGGILRAAAGGKSVVIHCRGGLGRSGLVAACCLVALGLGAESAITAVRATRKGTIETDAQEQTVREFWSNVLRGSSWAFAEPREAQRASPIISAPFSRFLGCLIGGGLGDALGYPVEFIGSSKAIVNKFGEAPPERLDYATPGQALVSDDTQMTLFIAEGIIRAIQRATDRGIGSVNEVLLRAMLRWHDTQTMSHPPVPASLDNGWLLNEQRLYSCRAPGNTCMSALAARAKNVEGRLNDSKGCGGIMRSAPIGLAYSKRAEAFSMASESANSTHNHPLGYLPSGYLASVVSDVAWGLSLEDAITLADDLLRRLAAGQTPFLNLADQKPAAELLRWTARARKAAEELGRSWSPDVVQSLGAGWTGEEALAISLCCALTVRDGAPDEVAKALWAAVVHGGDSDSTGAITGNILGAQYGIEAFPVAWANQVELGDVMERLAGDLYAAAVLHQELDYDMYPPN